MANFGTLVITTAGMDLQGKVEAGRTTLTFNRVAIGDGTLPGGTSLSSLTNLINPKMSVAINSITVNKGLATLKFTFSNSGLITGFYIRELGIFANDPDAGEILYAVVNAGDSPDYLPAEGSNIVEEIFEVVAAIGSTSNVTATIDKSLTFLPLVGGNMAGAINEAEVTMAAAATMNIGTAAGNFILVTGTTTITAFDNVQAGSRRTLKFNNPLTITYNSASMILPGAASLAVSAGDVAEFVSLGNGNWICINYQPAVGNLPSNGTAVNAATATNVTTNINGRAITHIFESDGVTAKNATNALITNRAKSIGGYAGVLNNMLGTWPQILAPMLRQQSLTLNSGENNGGSITFDGTYLYVVNKTLPTIITKINSSTMTRIGSLELEYGEWTANSITFDGAYLYVANVTNPTIITKINPNTMTRIGSLTLNSGENNACTITFDGTYLYAVNSTYPTTIITKIDPSGMTRIGSLSLNSGEYNAWGVTFDGTYLYVVNQTEPTIITKINPRTMTRIGSLTLNSGENNAHAITFDGIYLYVVNLGNPTIITKVNPRTMTRIGSLTLNSGENNGCSVTFDGTYLYVANVTNPTIITKINPNTMTRIGSLSLNSGKNNANSIIFDGTYLYVVNSTNPTIVKQIDTMGNYWS
jgi:DNA-binding beta-propeller fold protein YncE